MIPNACLKVALMSLAVVCLSSVSAEPNDAAIQAISSKRKIPEVVPRHLRDQWAPLGLPRLRAKAFPGDPVPMAEDSFEVELLSASETGGGRRIKDDGRIRMLELDAAQDWSVPLRRSSARNPVFVSILLNASPGTKVNVGGVTIRVVPSPLTGSVQLEAAELIGTTVGWRPLGMHIREENYSGQQLAALPVLTLALNPAGQACDVYADARLVASGVSVLANDKPIEVQAGQNGAWVLGLVQTSQNPFFEDENLNAIDDSFEIRSLGKLLPANADVSERSELAEKWRQTESRKPIRALVVNRPTPNNRRVESRAESK